ncbi:MAG: hypothetical protein B6D59_00025 [Campylobacteraceae bacterium 4484_4]|nr:MAG: hypothetical protein B6D59_00025 [Campylobacteraceae bacterium 4484_4]
MTSLKNHISFIIPLFILLFSIQFAVMLDRGVKDYEARLTGEYSIVAVSDKALKTKEIRQKIPLVSNITEIPKERYLSRLKNEIPKADLVYLKSTLPHFYSIKLKILPESGELERITKQLGEIGGITRVETFKKTFNKFHQFLRLAKTVSILFTLFIFVISLLLILKQMEIWTLEHKRRMYIMGLFGAPFWMKSASLYKSVVIDALIAALLVGTLFLYLPSLANLQEIYRDLGIDLRTFHFLSDTFKLILISLIISLLSVTVIIMRRQES